MISQYFVLDLRPGGAVPVVHCSQYDAVPNMYRIYLKLDGKNFVESGYTASVNGTKPDKKGFAYDATYAYDADSTWGPIAYATVNLEKQMSCVPGPVRCKLELKKTGGDFFSAPFILMVDAAGLADDVDISDTVLPEYIDAAERAAREAASYVNSSEAWARGTRDGVPVTSGDETYQNNSKFYAEQSGNSATSAGTHETHAQEYAANASSAATAAAGEVQNAEAYARGTRGGTPVESSDVTYHNNSKYYAEQASDSATAAAASVAQGTQVDFWVQGGVLYVQQTIEGVQQPAQSLGSVTSPNTDYTFETIADMNTAISNSEVINNGMCYVAENGGFIYRNQSGTAKLYASLQTIGSRASNSTIGTRSFAQGSNNTASAQNASAQGLQCFATGLYSHAEGNTAHAEGQSSHAEGQSTYAQGSNAHAEGYGTYATALDTHAEGYQTYASSSCAHAEGYYTKAGGSYQHAGGIYNVEKTETGNYMVIGNGSSSARSNCFRVYTSAVYGAGAYNSSGADYAEYFEWADANSSREDRAGRFVTLDGDKIKLADPEDDFILGIVSGNASVIGDSFDDQWAGMYERDIFGRYVFEDAEIPAETEEIDGETIEIIPAHMEHRLKLNPEYDGTQAYMPRSERAEWDAVGMIGKLVALDDGTCEVNGYCKPSDGGIATAAEGRTRYRVMKRLDENHIQVVIV